MNNTSFYTIFLILLIPICFSCDIVFGSVHIPFDVFKSIFFGLDTDSIWYNIIINIRFPRAIAAVLVGIALPISGLLMQTLFRNPLADPYILGVSTGASLGVALFSLAGGLFTFTALQGTIGLVLAALLGSLLIMLLILAISTKIKNITTLLIVGILFGSFSAAIVNVLQYFSNPNEIRNFVLWTMGSLTNIDKTSLLVMTCCILPTLLATFFIHKPLDALLLGENYAHALGVKTTSLRLLIIFFSTILASVITAYAGPIGFIGLVVPHLARFIFKTSSHKKLILNSILIGINLMLICDVISQLPGFETSLPINTVTAIFGAPIVILVILKGRRNQL